MDETYIALLVFLAVNFAAATSGAVFKPGAWYERLDKPDWRPPNWAFPIVWTILYAMIAVSGWMAWTAAGPGEALVPMALYGIHMVLNAAWSAVFFGMRQPGWAFVEVLGLWGTLVAVMVAFYPLDPVATWLLVPYFLWGSFAGVLNFAIWRRNRGSPLIGAREVDGDVRPI